MGYRRWKISCRIIIQAQLLPLEIFKGKHNPLWPPGGASIYQTADIGQVLEGESDVLDVKGERLDAVVVIGVHEPEIYILFMHIQKGKHEGGGRKGFGR